MQVDTKFLNELIRDAARAELLPRFGNVERAYKRDGSIVTEADFTCQNHIHSALGAQYPDIVFLSEEMSEEQRNEVVCSGKPMWCLDPLDGTSNFAAGIPYFCVSLSLIVNGVLELAIIYDPVRDEIFNAERNKGARKDGDLLAPLDTGIKLSQAIALIDFKRLPNAIRALLIAQPPYGSQRSFGSVALDLCWLAAGRVHVYLHGRSNLWDYGAGALVCAEAGIPLCTLSGHKVSANSMAPCSIVGAANPALFSEWRTALGV